MTAAEWLQRIDRDLATAEKAQVEVLLLMTREYLAVAVEALNKIASWGEYEACAETARAALDRIGRPCP